MSKNLDCFNCDYIKAFEIFATDVQSDNKENHYKLPQKFQELKQTIDLTLEKTYEKFTDSMDHIKKSFYTSYKSLIDQVMNDFTALRRKFDDYTIQFQQELSEDIIHQKMLFFREECQSQVLLIQTLKKENEQLKHNLKELRQDNESQYHVMVKLGQEKLKLIKYIEENRILTTQDEIQKGRTLSLYNKDTTATVRSSKSKPSNMVFTQSASIFIQDQPMRLLSSQKQRSEQKVGSRQSRRVESKPEIRSEEKNYAEESGLGKTNQFGSPRTIYISNQHQPLLDVWRECVKQHKEKPLQILESYFENEQIRKVFEMLTFTNQKCDNSQCPVNQLLYGEKQDARLKIDNNKKNMPISLKYRVKTNGLSTTLSTKTPEIHRNTRVKDYLAINMKTEEKVHYFFFQNLKQQNLIETQDLEMNRLSEQSISINVNRFLKKRSLTQSLKQKELNIPSQKIRDISLVY